MDKKRDYILILVVALAVLSGVAEYIQMRKMKADIRKLQTDQAAQSGVLISEGHGNCYHPIAFPNAPVFTLPREGGKEAGMILELKYGAGTLEWVNQ